MTTPARTTPATTTPATTTPATTTLVMITPATKFANTRAVRQPVRHRQYATFAVKAMVI